VTARKDFFVRQLSLWEKSAPDSGSSGERVEEKALRSMQEAVSVVETFQTKFAERWATKRDEDLRAAQDALSELSATVEGAHQAASPTMLKWLDAVLTHVLPVQREWTAEKQRHRNDLEMAMNCIREVERLEEANHEFFELEKRERSHGGHVETSIVGAWWDEQKDVLLATVEHAKGAQETFAHIALEKPMPTDGSYVERAEQLKWEFLQMQKEMNGVMKHLAFVKDETRWERERTVGAPADKGRDDVALMYGEELARYRRANYEAFVRNRQNPARHAQSPAELFKSKGVAAHGDSYDHPLSQQRLRTVNTAFRGFRQ
jgi:hypothetical protein